MRQSLGDTLREFHPQVKTRLVLAASGALMIACGIYFCILQFTPRDQGGVSISRRLLLGLPILGAVSLLLAYRLGKRRLLVCQGGVVFIRGGSQEGCRWEELSDIVSGPNRFGGRGCSLLKRDGSRIAWGEMEVGQYDATLDLLRVQAESHGVRWREEAIKPDTFDRLRWLIFGLIGVGIVALLFAAAVLSLAW